MKKILECEYIEKNQYTTWKEQKKMLLEKYSKKYTNKKIKITRVRTDTKGLVNYIVEEI